MVTNIYKKEQYISIEETVQSFVLDEEFASVPLNPYPSCWNEDYSDYQSGMKFKEIKSFFRENATIEAILTIFFRFCSFGKWKRAPSVTMCYITSLQVIRKTPLKRQPYFNCLG